MTNKKLKLEVCSDAVFSKLPVDIVFDIFSRLPLETISECKWVSKTWYGLVLHPRFADIYFASCTSPPCVIFFDRYLPSYLIDPIRLRNYETSATAYDLQLKGFKENFRIKCGWICFELVGTVNGLICFSPESHDYESAPYYICNPITRDYLMPPTSPKKHIDPIASGFGFDSLNNEYKLLRILRNFSEDGNEVEIFNLANLKTTKDDKCIVILSFNVAIEDFNLIELPPLRNIRGRGLIDFEFMVLGEHLCVIEDASWCEKEVWMMKDYGVHSSWAKEYVFERDFLYCNWPHHPLSIELKNGELLLLNGDGHLCYFDLKKKILSPINVRDRKNEPAKLEKMFPIFLNGSLFSPKTVGYTHRTKCGWVCFDVVGTANDLICFSPENHDYEPAPYYICNPITRDYLIPPTSFAYKS
ncbi:hypothetical protein IFM89_019348 [Coptis chinensis]|uniref:F-box domain-containing protein n=1 Tax=Coptis chinensis TaxID=261450 RepID=A0A835I1H7_9MAGN|nr:hypothetical protein IFM89_019348 [Coptis chinensis]